MAAWTSLSLLPRSERRLRPLRRPMSSGSALSRLFCSERSLRPVRLPTVVSSESWLLSRCNFSREESFASEIVSSTSCRVCTGVSAISTAPFPAPLPR